MRRILWNGTLAVALVLLTTGIVWAADESHGEKTSGGLDIFAGALDLAIWTIVVFLLLLFIMTKFAWKPMLEGLRKPRKAFAGRSTKPRSLGPRRQRMRGEFQRKLDAAHQEIPKLMEDCAAKAQELAEEMRTKANADIAAERQRCAAKSTRLPTRRCSRFGPVPPRSPRRSPARPSAVP